MNELVDNLDPGAGPLYFLDPKTEEEPSLALRVSVLAIPFLRMAPPTAHLATVASLGYQSYRFYQNGDREEFVLALGMAGLFFGRPKWAASMSLLATFQDCSHPAHAFALLIQLWSIHTTNFTISAASLLISAGQDVWQAVGDFEEGRWLEGVTRMGLATIRVGGAMPHLAEMHRDLFGNDVTQAELDQLLAQKGDLNQHLRDHGFRSELFELELTDVDGVVFRDLDLVGCQLRGSATHTTWERVSLRDCSCANVSFDNARFESVRFWHCDGSGASFACADIDFSLFWRSNLRHTMFPATSVRDSAIVGSDLTDTHLLDTERDLWLIGCDRASTPPCAAEAA